MKKTLILFGLFLFINIASASQTQDFIASIVSNPQEFSIILSENLSYEEITKADDLAIYLDILTFYDDEEIGGEKFIIVGSWDKNQKTRELGDNSSGELYVKGNSLFISGNSSFNIIKMQEIIDFSPEGNLSEPRENITVEENDTLIEEGGDAVAETESFSDENDIEIDQSELINSNNKFQPEIKDLGFFGKANYDTIIPAVILGIVAFFIVVIFILSFARRPKLVGARSR